MVFSSPVLDVWNSSSFEISGPISRNKRDLKSNCKPHLYISAVLCLRGVSSRAITCCLQHPHIFFNEKTAARGNRYNIMSANGFIQSPLQAVWILYIKEYAESLWYFPKTVSVFSVLGIYKYQPEQIPSVIPKTLHFGIAIARH